jgi:hypothetical protein
MDATQYTHIFNTILPPSVEDAPICGATLPRDWSGRGKPECPVCNRRREALIAAAKRRARSG